MSSRPKVMWYRRLFESAVVVAISAGILVSLEMGLRFWFPDKVAFTNDNDEWTLVPHPERIYTLAPNVISSFARDAVNGGEVIEWKTNSLGFRGPEPRWSDARLIVYGDSNIQARFSRLENTFVARLEALLKEKWHKDVEVLNGGVNGYGPDQSYLKMSSELPQLKPDVVVLSVFADNDFGDIVRNRLFSIADGTLVSRSDSFVFAPPSRLERFRKYLSQLLIARVAHKAIERVGGASKKAPRANAVRTGNAYVDELLDFSAMAHEGFIHGGAFVPVDHYDADLALKPDAESSRLKVDLMRKVLAKVRALAVALRIRMVILIQPSVIDLTSNWNRLDFKALGAFPAYRRERLSGTVESICRELGLEYVNLMPVFEMHDPSSLYFRGYDNHWNDRGQDLAARAAADYIASPFLTQR